MNVEDMTAEQLMAAAEAKAGADPAASTRTVEIDGVEVAIDLKRLQTWKAFQLVRRIDGGTPVEQVDAAIAFAELVSDQTEERIVERLGGDDAATQDVVAFVMGIISAAYPKN